MPSGKPAKPVKLTRPPRKPLPPVRLTDLYKPKKRK
jgi:hypothetical protein